MNTQPLELYGESAFFGGGMKLLHRNFDGALIKIKRHYDNVVAQVYPNQFGVVDLDSAIAVNTAFSSATNLGQFINHPLGNSPEDIPGELLTVGVSIIYDQSPQSNNLSNSDSSTQFLLCKNGEIKRSTNNDYFGLELFTEGKEMYFVNVPQQFSLHTTFTPQLESAVQRTLLKSGTPTESSTGNFEIKYSANLLLNLNSPTQEFIYVLHSAVDIESNGVVFIDEDYYTNYNLGSITFESTTPKILTLEFEIADSAYSPDEWYTYGGVCGGMHSLIVYSLVDQKYRRHETNQILVEDIPELYDQLFKFSPDSYYNHFYGASAIFATTSLAGIISTSPVKLIRIARSNNQYGYIFPNNLTDRVDVYADASGRLSLDSPIANPFTTYTTAATILGDFLNAAGYTDVDNIGFQAWGFTLLWYDQSINQRTATAVLTAPPTLYRGDIQRFIPHAEGSDPGISKAFQFTAENYTYPKKLRLDATEDEILYPKSIFIVYANRSTVAENASVLSNSQTFVPIYTKTDGGDGFSIEGPGFDTVNTNYGLDTNTHVAAISFGDTPTLQIDENPQINFSYELIETYVNGRWRTNIMVEDIGVGDVFIHAIIVYEQDKLNSFSEIIQYLTAYFGIEDASFPQINDNSFLGIYPNATHAFSTQKLGNNAYFVATAESTALATINVRLNRASKQFDNRVFKQSGATIDGYLLDFKNQIDTTDTFNANPADKIKIYSGDTQSLVRSTSPTRAAIAPKSNAEYLTRSSSISLSAGSSMFIVGTYPLGPGYLLGDGTSSIYADASNFVISSDSVTYTSTTTMQADEFFVMWINRTETELHVNINLGTTQIFNCASSQSIAFNTLFSLSSSSPSYYAGTLHSLIVYNANTSSNRVAMTEQLYSIHNYPIVLGAPAPPPENPPVTPTSESVVISNYTEATFASRSLNPYDTSHNLTINYPEGIQSGNLLIATIASTYKTDNINGPLTQIPVGWTKISTYNASNYNTSIAIMRVADGTEANTLNLTVAKNLISRACAAAQMFRITGANVSLVSDLNIGVNTETSIHANSLTIAGLSAGNPGLVLGLFTKAMYSTSYFSLNNTDGWEMLDYIQIAESESMQSYSGLTTGIITLDQPESATSSNISLSMLGVGRHNGVQIRIPGIALPLSSQIPSAVTALLLNTYSGATVAYSLRLLDNTYTNSAVRVRRASDNTEQDIGFDANGDLDTSALASFCSGTDGFIVRWYDQSGNGGDATQATTAAQPQIVSSGSVILENGKPKVQGALGKSLRLPSGISGGVKIFSVGRIETDCVFIGSFNNSDFLLTGQNGSTSTVMAANATITSVRKNGSNYTLSTRGSFYTDFSAQHIMNLEASISFANFDRLLGYNNYGILPMMSQQALIIYPSTSTHAAADIETAMNDYYNIYP